VGQGGPKGPEEKLQRTDTQKGIERGEGVQRTEASLFFDIARNMSHLSVCYNATGPNYRIKGKEKGTHPLTPEKKKIDAPKTSSDFAEIEGERTTTPDGGRVQEGAQVSGKEKRRAGGRKKTVIRHTYKKGGIAGRTERAAI